MNVFNLQKEKIKRSENEIYKEDKKIIIKISQRGVFVALHPRNIVRAMLGELKDKKLRCKLRFFLT